MNQKLLSFLTFFTCTFFAFINEALASDKFQIQRPDGSILTGYITLPEKLESYPVAFIVHGSPCESIKSWHDDFNSLAATFESALVTLEKQGIYSPEEKDMWEYDQFNSFDRRVEDHLFFIQKLREGQIIPGWNGAIVMLGGSEGGRVSISVSSQTPEVKATMLYCCGGGLTSIEELKITFLKFLTSFGQSDEEIASDLHFLEEKIYEMINNPASDQYFLSYTYKWWASHFSRDFLSELLSINHPIFYVHGSADQVIPVESADKVAEIFRERGKDNLVYLRLHDHDHDMRQFPPAVTLAMFKMLKGVKLFPERIQ